MSICVLFHVKMGKQQKMSLRRQFSATASMSLGSHDDDSNSAETATKKKKKKMRRHGYHDTRKNATNSIRVKK